MNDDKEIPAHRQLMIDANDENTRAKGLVFLKGLIENFGLQAAIAICVVATEQALVAILHCDTPMPEGNIASVAALLDGLRANVMNHTDCALKINGVGKKEKVH